MKESPPPNNIYSTPPPSLSAARSAQNTGGYKIAIAAPRGFAKSTLCSFLKPLWSIYCNNIHFIILISNTHAQAAEFLRAIKVGVEGNEALTQYAPHIRPNPDKWAEDEIEFLIGPHDRAKILAMGQGAQLRGLKFLHYRPEVIVIDDGEDDEMVRSATRRENYQWWIDHVVMNANPHAELIKIGTILHEAAMLNRLIRQQEDSDKKLYADWTGKLYKALEEDTSIWEQHQSTAQLEAEKERDPFGFSQEKLNTPVSAAYAPFKLEYFTDALYWTQLPDSLRISITCDPACTDKEYSDETAISVAGWDPNGVLYVLENLHDKHTDPSKIVDWLLGVYVKWTKNETLHPNQHLYCVGIEKIAFQKFLIHLFKQEAKRRDLHPYVKELAGDKDKTRRIWQLEPLFRHNRIKLRPDMLALEQQLQAFPRGAHDDQCDALAYQVQLGGVLPSTSTPTVTREGMTFKEYAELTEKLKDLRAHNPGVDSLIDPRFAQLFAGR